MTPFDERLRRELEALAVCEARDDFGFGPRTLGAELELSLIDEFGMPAPINREVIDRVADPRCTVELDRFNLEINADPVELAGRPFSELKKGIAECIDRIATAAAELGARPVTIGILPTVEAPAAGESLMTDLARYRELSDALVGERRAPFRLRINGDDPLDTTTSDVSLEGANTSLQIHLRVQPDRFADTFNAVQLTTAVAIAISGNSPFFLGHALWEETRIAVFKQATDPRPLGGLSLRPARVCFGHGWVRRGIAELFAEAVYLHPPLLTKQVADPDPLAVARAGGVPRLEALRLHHSSVWRWNRPVYDHTSGGHYRIEMRALPSGPTRVDMMANAAFAIGLALGLRDQIGAALCALPFEYCEHNFYRAAQSGLEAELLWPAFEGVSPRPILASELARELLPTAQRGLLDAGVESDEVDSLLEVISNRLDLGQTGARWQRKAVEQLEPQLDRQAALAAMLAAYLDHSNAGDPVASWPTEI